MNEPIPYKGIIQHIDGVMVVQPPSEVYDQFQIAKMRDAWMAAIDGQHPVQAVVCFDKVKFFSSEAIGVLVQFAKRIRQHGGDVKLCSMGEIVREIFDICRLVPTVFEVHNSTADAIKSFQT